MTKQEAISELESINAKTDYFLISDDARAEAIDMAISALNKQIQKQPMVITDGCDNSFWHLYCPTCGAAVGVYSKRLKNTAMYNSTNNNTCVQCGQMLDLELQEGE